MMKSFEKVLELDKVLMQAAEFTSNETSRDMILHCKPSTDLTEVRREV